MKQLIILSILLSHHYFIFGQTFALSNNTFTQPWQQKEARPPYLIVNNLKYHQRTHIGEGLIVAGGVLLAVSIIGISTTQANSEEGADNQFLFGLAGVGGLSMMIPGIIIFTYGRRYESKHKEQLTIIGKRNQLGLAYNF